MKSAQSKLAVLAAVPLTLTVALSSAPSGAAQLSDAHRAGHADVRGPSANGVSRPAEHALIRLGHFSSTPSVVGSLTAQSRTADQRRKATFRVNYQGFGPKARTAFQRAVNIWSTRINSKVPIVVSASFAPLGTNVLGSAGPVQVWRGFKGAPKPNTWYVDAVANKRAGRQLSKSPDIQARFSSSFKGWWFGAGRAPKGRVDFTSVVLHELGHGLGFIGAGVVSGGKGTVRLNSSPRLPLSYDRWTEGEKGKHLLLFPDVSPVLRDVLTSEQVYFDSPRVRAANGGKRARLYAPSVWQQGSSYSHLAEGVYPQGNKNSLMTPVIHRGETIRAPGDITRAIFRNIGW